MNQNICDCGYMKEIHEGKNMKKKTFALWPMALKISGSNIFFLSAFNYFILKLYGK